MKIIINAQEYYEMVMTIFTLEDKRKYGSKIS